MPEHHFRFSNHNNRDDLGRVWRRKAQERGYFTTRAQGCNSGVDWACAVRCSARESAMASNEGSNNLDDFDIEEVINWEEHNYASKNLDQHLGDIDLSSDLPTSGSPLQASHGTQPQARNRRTVIIPNQVIGSQQQPEQAASMPRRLSQTSSSVLNPVFPRDAGYMLSDIRQELTHPRVLPDNHHEVQPSFPSENFDLPSIQHGRRLPTSGSQVLNFIPGHNQHIAVSGSQLGRTIAHHPTLRNGMQTFSQTGLHSNIANVDESLNHGLDHGQGEDSSIDQLIEDIVERDMPQGVGDTVEFSSHDVALVSQPQQIHHVMAQTKPSVTTSTLSSNSMVSVARNTAPMHTNTGSPIPGSNPVTGGNIPHPHSPLSQKPASPAIPKSASSQVQQYKTSQMRGNITAQQQPHSPLAASPRSAPQRSPQNPPQRSPQTPSAQSPPSSVMSQNMPSPMSTGAMNINSSVIGNMGMPHSPVPSPLNIASPQSQRLARQASPGGCNIGSPVSPAVQQTFQKSQGLQQNYMTQVSGQNAGWTQSQFMANQQRPPVCAAQGSIPSPGQQRQTITSQAGGSVPSPGQPRQTMQGGVPSPGQPRQALQGSVPSPGQPRQTMQGGVPSPGQPRQALQGSVPSPGQPRQTMQGSVPSPGQTRQAIPGNVPSPGQPKQTIPGNVPSPRQPTIGNVQSVGQPQRQTSSIPQGQLQRQPMPGNPAILLQQQQKVQTSLPSQAQPQEHFQHPRQLQRQNSQGNASSTLQQRHPAEGSTSASVQQMQQQTIIPGQQQQSNKPPISKTQQTYNNVNVPANAPVTQQTNSGIAGQQVSAMDTAAVLRGLTALQGTNVIPFQIKQGTNQQLQAIKIPQNSANLDILKQAAQATGKPMTINTSQGQVLCYILPKNTVNTTAGAASTQGQQVKMVMLNTKTNSGSNIVHGNATSTISSVSSTGQKSVAVSNGNPAVALQQSVALTTAKQTPIQTTALSGKPRSSFKANATPTAVNQRLVENPSTAQNVNTTRITFVNESTAVDHFVSISDTQPLTTTVASLDSKMTPTLQGDSDDSDTPLAVLAKHLKKANGEEKKKKKKKKGEKRKKKEKATEKPLPAFQIFFKETQAAIRQQNPSIDFENVTKIVTQMWENLPEDQRKVYQAKHEKAKKDFEKDLLEKKKMEPSPKLRKLETTTPSPLSSPKTTTPSITTAQPTTNTTTAKEPTKQESITLKIPKAILNKSDLSIKPKTSIASKTAASTTFAPTKTKKSKLSINPISQRVCIREGCNMPARTTKERGTQYCSNECTVAHCRNVFQSWVTKRRDETIQVS